MTAEIKTPAGTGANTTQNDDTNIFTYDSTKNPRERQLTFAELQKRKDVETLLQHKFKPETRSTVIKSVENMCTDFDTIQCIVSNFFNGARLCVPLEYAKSQNRTDEDFQDFSRSHITRPDESFLCWSYRIEENVFLHIDGFYSDFTDYKKSGGIWGTVPALIAFRFGVSMYQASIYILAVLAYVWQDEQAQDVINRLTGIIHDMAELENAEVCI